MYAHCGARVKCSGPESGAGRGSKTPVPPSPCDNIPAMKGAGIKDIISRLGQARMADRVAEDLGGDQARRELLAVSGYSGQPDGLAGRLRADLARALPLARDPADLRRFGRFFSGKDVMDQAREEAASAYPAPGDESPRPSSQVRQTPEEKTMLWPWSSGQRAARLARAAALTGDEDLALAAVRTLERFCRANPPLMGPGWRSSRVTAVRVLNWLLALRLLGEAVVRRGRELVPALLHLRVAGLVLAQELGAAPDQARPLDAGPAGALLFLGSCLPFLPEAEQWLELGRERLGPSLRAWSRPGAPLAAGWLAVSAQWGGLGLWLGMKSNLELPECVAGLTHLAGLCRAAAPPWGDGGPALDWGGPAATSVLGFERERDPYTTAANLAALLLSNPELRAGRVMDEGLFWLLGPQAADRLRPLAPAKPPPPADCPGGGLSAVCALAGGRKVSLWLRTCPRLPGAAAPWPAQALALGLCVDGKALLTAPGPAGSGPLAPHLRGRSAQNAVVVDQKEPCGGRTELESLEADQGRAFMAASFDGYLDLDDPVTLRRRVFCDPAGGLVNVVDQILAAREHLCQIFFHLAAGSRATRTEDGALFLEGPWGRALMRPDPKAQVEVIQGRANPPLGWLCDRLGRVSAAPVVRVTASTVGSARLTTAIALVGY